MQDNPEGATNPTTKGHFFFKINWFIREILTPGGDSGEATVDLKKKRAI